MRKACALALSLLAVLPGAGTALELKNVRATCGPFGVPRTETKFLPGDALFLHFDIQGIKVDPDSGLANYLVGMEIVDGAGKSIFKQKETPAQVVAALGGTTLPLFATFYMGTDTKPGKFSAKITITDRASTSKEVATTSFDFEMQPPAFGIVQPRVPAIALASQDIELHFGVVGMARDDKRIPNVELITRILDEKGKPTLAKPLNRFIVNKDLLPEVKVKDLDVFVTPPVLAYLNRSGRFIVEMEAIDHITKKSVKVQFPIRVLEPGSGGN